MYLLTVCSESGARLLKVLCKHQGIIFITRASQELCESQDSLLWQTQCIQDFFLLHHMIKKKNLICSYVSKGLIYAFLIATVKNSGKNVDMNKAVGVGGINA